MRAGLRLGLMQDPSRPAWDGSPARPIAWAAWYPADATATTARLRVGGQGAPWFDLGDIARNAPVRDGLGLLPVVMLSHGTGGCALDLGWLGRRLAERTEAKFKPENCLSRKLLLYMK